MTLIKINEHLYCYLRTILQAFKELEVDVCVKFAVKFDFLLKI